MRVFARECRDEVACFHLVVNEFMSGPIYFAGTVLEVDVVSGIFAEVWFDFYCQWYDYVLKRVYF